MLISDADADVRGQFNTDVDVLQLAAVVFPFQGAPPPRPRFLGPQGPKKTTL